MFLRRRGGEVTLVKGEFIDNLEEFGGLPLRERKKTLKKKSPQGKSA